MSTPAREDAPDFAYLVFNEEGLLDSFEDEDEAYRYAKAWETARVVTYKKAD